jgi:hypothetical protein
MQNVILLSVPDVIDPILSLSSEPFHAGIVFLLKTKWYQRINSVACKCIAEPCRSWVNWFACQPRVKLKSARAISENRLTAGTKLKIEQFFKTFEDLIGSFLPELIFGADETMVNRSDKLRRSPA